MGQTINVYSQYPGGAKSAMNIAAAAVVKASPGILYRAAISTAATTSGALTLNDANSLVTAQTITAITAANPGVVTVSSGGSTNPFAVGNSIAFTSVGGMTQLNTLAGTVTAIGGVTTAWTITLSINTTAFTAYTSGGTCASYGAANQVVSVAYGNQTSGQVVPLDWPCLVGILVSAVGGTAGLYAVSYL